MSKQKKWITYVCITAILCSTLIGCSSNKQTTVDKQASPTPKVLVSDEDKNSNLGQWGRAMGSVLIAINEGNVYYFGGYEPTDGNQKAAATILQKSWNISNRKQLIDQMLNLSIHITNFLNAFYLLSLRKRHKCARCQPKS